jgi:3-methyladenine DNA glycosylase AlkD
MAESHVMTGNAADRVARPRMGKTAIAAEAGAIGRGLRSAAIPGRAAREKAYLKSDLEFAGTPAGAIRSVARAWSAARPGLDHADLLAVTAALWAQPVFECRAAAVELLRHRPGLLQAGDAAQIEAMLRTSHTWALVDNLAEHVMGGLTQTFPQLNVTLDRWAGDGDFWVRRSALLTLLGPLRRGGGDFERFGRYADAMLAEREFFIRKAIGWVLRDTARRRPELVAVWLAPRVHLASGITVREAVKPLAPGTREMLMAGYRGKYPVTLPAPH